MHGLQDLVIEEAIDRYDRAQVASRLPNLLMETEQLFNYMTVIYYNERQKYSYVEMKSNISYVINFIKYIQYIISNIFKYVQLYIISILYTDTE